MKNNVSIADGIYIIGVNDRRTALFENMWPLPEGVSYNCYLIVDDKTVLLDTVRFGSEECFVERLEAHLDGRPLDYLVVNHMEPDHSGEIGDVMARWPGVKIIGNDQTRKILNRYYGDMSNCFMEVADCDTLSIGRHTLRFHMTPWVHWPETMMTYEESERILFCGDAFGTFGTVDGYVMDGGPAGIAGYVNEMRRYYSNIVGKYNRMVQKALAKLATIDMDMLCPVHGPVWQKHAKEVVALYDKWSRGEPDEAVMVVYASMYDNTARMADHVASVISAAGVRDVKVYDVSKTHISYLISELWRCRYVVLGSCSYNGDMFPLMEFLCSTIKSYGITNRSLAIFGTGSWGGGGLRTLKIFASECGWELMGEPTEVLGLATGDKLAALEPLAKAVADSYLKNK